MTLALRHDDSQEKRFTDRVKPRHPHALKSLADRLEESPVVLAHLARLFKRPGAFFIQAPKVALDIPDVELDIAADDIGIVPNGLWIARDKGPGWRKTGCGDGIVGQTHQHKYSLRPARSAQPEVTHFPYFLDHMHGTSLCVE